MPDSVKFTKEKGLKIVEDWAQSHFAEIDNIRSGMFGDVCFKNFEKLIY